MFLLVTGSIGLGLAYLLFTDLEYANWKTLFKNCKLHKDKMYPKLKEKKKTPYGYCLRFSLPLGLSSGDFDKKKAAIEQYLGKKVEIKYKSKNILIEVYERELEKEYPFEKIETKGVIEFPIGYSFGKKINTVDLADHGPHMLIAGESGSGKSTVLRSIIANLILTKNKRKIKIHLIDLKNGAEFNIFKKCDMVVSFSRNRDEAKRRLYKISNTVDYRYNLFYENDVVDINEYNRKFPRDQLDYEIIFIDEFADLRDEDDSIEIIEELAAKARACGIHLVIATQRPDAKILNGRIKANVPVILGLKTMNEVNSRIIIDHNGLENLRGKGHGMLKKGKEIELQSMYLIPSEARDLVKHTYIEEKKDDKTDDTSGEVKDFSFLGGMIK